MRKLSAKALRYLRIIGSLDDASVPLTRGFTKQADELRKLGFAAYIYKARGGCDVALTQAGIDYLDSLSPQQTEE